jgi:hypothetical protein
MIIQPDLSFAEDGGYWSLSAHTDAGRKFVKEHYSASTPDSRVYERISLGASAYPQALEAARLAGLTVVQR